MRPVIKTFGRKPKNQKSEVFFLWLGFPNHLWTIRHALSAYCRVPWANLVFMHFQKAFFLGFLFEAQFRSNSQSGRGRPVKHATFCPKVEIPLPGLPGKGEALAYLSRPNCWLPYVLHMVSKCYYYSGRGSRRRGGLLRVLLILGFGLPPRITSPCISRGLVDWCTACSERIKHWFFHRMTTASHFISQRRTQISSTTSRRGRIRFATHKRIH